MTRARRWARGGPWRSGRCPDGVRSLAVMVGPGAVVLSAPACGGEAAAGRPRQPAPTLGTVVIPNLGPGYAVTSQGPLQRLAVRLRRTEPVGRRRGAVHAREDHLDLRAGVAGRRRPQPGAGPAGPLPERGRGPGVPAGRTALARVGRDRELGRGAVHPGRPPRDLLRGDQPGRCRRGRHHARRGLRGPAVLLLGGVGQRAAHLPRQRRTGGRGPVRGHGAGARWRHRQRHRRAGSGLDGGTKKGVSGGTIVLAVVVVAVLSLAVATPGCCSGGAGAGGRRHGPCAARAGAPSGGDAVDDLREHSG